MRNLLTAGADAAVHIVNLPNTSHVNYWRLLTLSVEKTVLNMLWILWKIVFMCTLCIKLPFMEHLSIFCSKGFAFWSGASHDSWMSDLQWRI